jgi:protocatechuate 3,4-dioxygenase beta subunit
MWILSNPLSERSDMPDNRRRKLVFAAAGLLPLLSAPASAAFLSTPRQSAGPFYPTEPPLDDDNNLVRIHDGKLALGEVSDLSGRLLDRNGQPLSGVRIEIWQCDANGRYRHPRERGSNPIDPAFQGFGHAVTDAQGRYRFRTIKPVTYPGRAPHIHVAVRPTGDSPLITQLYVAGEPRNETDFLYRRIPTEQRHLVTAEFVGGAEAQGPLRANWDIIFGAMDSPA